MPNSTQYANYLKGKSTVFNNRTQIGRNNIVGRKMYRYRKSLGISQREVADKLQDLGLAVDKNAVQRMESGERFITDIELVYLSKIYNVTVEELYGSDNL